MGNKKKDIEQCKHPNSRKTQALAKQMKKISNREKVKKDQTLKMNIVAEKYMWFKERIDDDVTCCTAQQVEDLINEYLHRFDDELEQIKIKNSIGMRKNRQHANREDIIKMTIKREEEEYKTAGIELPDLMTAKPLDIFKKWNGELRFMQNLKIRRFSHKFLQTEKEKQLKENCEKVSSTTMDTDN